eukprot:TRINITY_DN4300_c0_g1_i2.p1 TRINITY_DN4300_c0_g1~~TRINITY_DN4300_c0_g1_i2.p1  ORF type:complete len:640 (+),score=138.51 TRINITY_DN4300_c0_g1_i2:12-1931(+)
MKDSIKSLVQKTNKKATEFFNLGPNPKDDIPAEVIVKDKKTITTKDNLVFEKELKGGCYKFNFQIEADNHPSCFALGTLVLRDKNKKIVKEVVFQLFGSLYLHRTLNGAFSILKESEPYHFHVELASKVTGFEFPVIWQLNKTMDICQSFYFTVDGDISLDPSELSQLVNFQGIADLPQEEREKAIKEFKAVDADHNGKLDVDEFFQLLKKFYPPITIPEATTILSQIDLNRNGVIDLEEFLDAYVYCGSQLHTYNPEIRKAGLASSQHLSTGQSSAVVVEKDVPKTPVVKKSDFEWEIPFEQITFQDKLGEGSFGIVHKGKWRGVIVAVKQLKFHNLNQDVIDEFQKELALLGKLRHPNVVLLMGASTSPPNLCMVTEFLAAGSLFDMIHQRKQQFPLTTILRMALQSAQGLNYLHLSNPPIIHRDLKSANLLVDMNYNVKICDFGLSCIKQAGQNLREVVGSPFWMAPEVIQGLDYDSKADVYSYGVCLYELMTGKIPFSEVVSEDPATIRHLYENIISGKRAPLPNYILPSVAKLITECWAPSQKQRPSFDDVITKIEAVQNEVHEQQQVSPYSNYYYNPQQQQYVQNNSNSYYNTPNYADPYQNYYQQYQQYQQQYSQYYQPHPSYSFYNFGVPQ